jgi:hypothetical protein
MAQLMLTSGQGSVASEAKLLAARPILFYCAIAVLLNALLALAWVIWRGTAVNQKQADQIIELQSQIKKR